MINDVSAATVARLPSYLRVIVDLATADIATVSSDRLAELAATNSATVRRDLASLEIGGTRGVGYDVKNLAFQIGMILGINQEWPVVIVGIGNLGRALANYDGLPSRGFPVKVLLDVDPQVVGTVEAGLEVRSFDELAALVAEHQITVGVIATPVAGAQQVADSLVEAGITSLLNFTAQKVMAPNGVVIRRVDLATELQILSFYSQRSAAASSGLGVPLEANEPSR